MWLLCPVRRPAVMTGRSWRSIWSFVARPLVVPSSSSGFLGPMLVPSSPCSPATGKPLRSSSDSRGYGSQFSSHRWSLLYWRHLSVVRPASPGDCYLFGLWAGDCSLPLWRWIHARIWFVACLPLLREWRTAMSQYP